jgi:hypothetical protein
MSQRQDSADSTAAGLGGVVGAETGGAQSMFAAFHPATMSKYLELVQLQQRRLIEQQHQQQASAAAGDVRAQMITAIHQQMLLANNKELRQWADGLKSALAASVQSVVERQLTDFIRDQQQRAAKEQQAASGTQSSTPNLASALQAAAAAQSTNNTASFNTAASRYYAQLNPWLHQCLQQQTPNPFAGIFPPLSQYFGSGGAAGGTTVPKDSPAAVNNGMSATPSLPRKKRSKVTDSRMSKLPVRVCVPNCVRVRAGARRVMHAAGKRPTADNGGHVFAREHTVRRSCE